MNLNLSHFRSNVITEREARARLMFESQGCTILEWWVDEDNIAHTRIKDGAGREMTFVERPMARNATARNASEEAS